MKSIVKTILAGTTLKTRIIAAVVVVMFLSSSALEFYVYGVCFSSIAGSVSSALFIVAAVMSFYVGGVSSEYIKLANEYRERMSEYMKLPEINHDRREHSRLVDSYGTELKLGDHAMFTFGDSGEFGSKEGIIRSTGSDVYAFVDGHGDIHIESAVKRGDIKIKKI